MLKWFNKIQDKEAFEVEAREVNEALVRWTSKVESKENSSTEAREVNEALNRMFDKVKSKEIKGNAKPKISRWKHKP